MADEADLLSAFMSEISAVEAQSAASTAVPEAAAAPLAASPAPAAAEFASPEVMGGDDDDANELYQAEASALHAVRLLSTVT